MHMLFVSLIGLVLLGFGLWRRAGWKRKAGAYSSWPAADATVLSAGLRTRTTLDDRNEEKDFWEPQVRYRYAVAGHSYEGSRAYWFDHSFIDRAGADGWLAAHGEGQAVKAYYDPAKPQASALMLNAPTSVPGGTWIWAGVALVLAGMILAIPT